MEACDARDGAGHGAHDLDALKDIRLFAEGIGDSFGGGDSLGEVLIAADDAGHACDRGQVGALAELELFAGERLEVVVGGMDDGRGIGLEGLDEDAAGVRAATSASGDLGDELEGALGGTKIGERESGVGIDDADKPDVGEVEAFSDHLGADEDADFCAREAFEEFVELAAGLHGVAVDADKPTRGRACRGEHTAELGFELFFDALGAHAKELDSAIANGAAVGDLLLGEAVVTADEVGTARAPSETVLDHAGIALAATENVPALWFRAGDVAGIAAAIEEEDGLSAVAEGFAKCVFERGTEHVFARAHPPTPPTSATACAVTDRRAGTDGVHRADLPLLAEIDDLDAGHCTAANALAKSPEGVAAARVRLWIRRCICPALEGRGRGAEYHGAAFELGAFDGHVAAVVARQLVLLVVACVFFIDDDDAETIERRKDGRARADDHAGLAASGGGPLGVTLRCAEAGMENGDTRRADCADGAKACLESARGLRSEGYFGHEDEGGLSLGEDALDDAEIDLGFAGACDAVEKVDAKAVERGGDALDRGVLIGGETHPLGHRGVCGARGGLLDEHRVGRAADAADFLSLNAAQQTRVHQFVQRADVGRADSLREHAGIEGQRLASERGDGIPGGTHGLGHLHFDERRFDAGLDTVEEFTEDVACAPFYGGGHHRGQDHPDRADVVAGDPAGEFDEPRGQADTDFAEDGFDFIWREPASCAPSCCRFAEFHATHFDDDAGGSDIAATEGDLDAAADFDRNGASVGECGFGAAFVHATFDGDAEIEPPAVGGGRIDLVLGEEVGHVDSETVTARSGVRRGNDLSSALMHNENELPLGRLALEDGSVFSGRAFGATGRSICRGAEVVFNTAMTGYQEALTDPSYSGQILVFTSPLIGNTGVNEEDLESAKVQVSGMVVRELARQHSNFRATTDLSTYLRRAEILGVTGVDTRALTRRLRVAGVMNAAITDVPRETLSDAALVNAAKTAPDMRGLNLVPLVGCTNDSKWGETLGEWSPEAQTGHKSSVGRRFRVLALDCGAKRNILRNLADRGCDITVVPHNISGAELKARFAKGEMDGLFVSNGPGDPAAVEATIDALKVVVGDPKFTIPTFGICLGHQLLSLAVGAKTYKLKFGHRGLNQPVLNTLTSRVEITSQNHGFAVDPESLKAVGGVPTHFNLNDNTLAGFCMKDRPVFAVQHHPEASPGPHDSSYLFDAFVQMMTDRKPLTEQVRGRAASVAETAPTSG